MKIKSNTLLLIVGILFVLICGLSFFFYTKYKSMMKYINNQFQTYNFNMQNQLVNFMDQYKNFITQNRPVMKSKEENQELDNFIADLENTDEDDLELEKEIQEVKREIKSKEEVNDVIEQIVSETETKALLKQKNHLPSIEEEDFDSFVNDLTKEQEEILIIDEEDEELPIIEEDEESEYEEVEDSDSEDEIVDSEDEIIDSEDEMCTDLQMIEDSEDDMDFDISKNDEVTLSEEKKEIKFEILPPSPKVEPIKIELPPRCDFIFKRGKNKGNTCGRKSHEDGRCKKHIGK